MSPQTNSPDSTSLGTTIRFFISSTFVDFQTERDVLQRRVFPELRTLCAELGYQLQPIDLRWGVSEEAGADRQTLRICLDELEHCRRLSPDFFFLIQLGDHYGSHILPPSLPGEAVLRLLPHLTAEERTVFDAAYRRDENAVTPAYVLLRAEGPERESDEVLRQVMVRAGVAAGLSDDERLLFEGSATHREIHQGLLSSQSEPAQNSAILCAVRSFSGRPQGPVARRFIEEDPARVAQVRQLKEKVLGRLPGNQVLRYTVDWQGDRGPVLDENALAAAYMGFLRSKLEEVVKARMGPQAAGAGRYDPKDWSGAYVIARVAGKDEPLRPWQDPPGLAKSAHYEPHRGNVIGRDAEIAYIVDYLSGNKGSGLPLVVAGTPGVGKSTVLAEAVKRAGAAASGAVVVTYYVGTTQGTGTLVELLHNMRRAIAHGYGEPQPTSILDENNLTSTVATGLTTHSRPLDKPLLLVIDAIDQLSTRTTRMDWLPTNLAPGVRVVVSMASDAQERINVRSRIADEQMLTLELGCTPNVGQLPSQLTLMKQRV